MTRVVVCSIFHNSTGYMDRYWDQIMPLRDKYDLSMSVTEGDSDDGTKDFVWAWNSVCPGNFQFQTVDHGGPMFGNIDHPQRWDQIAQVVVPTVDRALEMKPEVVLWVESDLVWETEAVEQLIDYAKAGKTVAPMVYAANSERYYDTWGFRLDGEQFLSYPPYFPYDPNPGNNASSPLRKIDSCGSCFATSDLETLAKWDGHWPYRAGGRLYVDPELRVLHP